MCLGGVGLTEPVGGVPFKQVSEETLSLHAEELRHAQLRPTAGETGKHQED